MFRIITNSAVFGLIVTLAIFVYEQYKNSEQTKEIVNNLMAVQESISTRYLGLFPDYLDRINAIFEDAQPKDSVIIFEDVLYYGFMSKPDQFKKMHRKLISLSDEGSHITIAYYNPGGRTFKRMVLDQYVATQYMAKMDMERRALVKGGRGRRISIRELRTTDSLICEQYFVKTRSDAPENFSRIVDRYRSPLANITGQEQGLDFELEVLYGKIDSIKTAWLDKEYDEICLCDFEYMYREISKALSEEYLKHGIELIPIDENLSMSCWLVADKAILAFPSKYATDEIGFFSQDPPFSNYIHTMLNGLRGNYTQVEVTPDAS